MRLSARHIGGFCMPLVLLAASGGCARLLAKHLPTEGVTMMEIPRPDNWVKPGHAMVTPDGSVVYGDYFPSDSPFIPNSSRYRQWYGFRWTQQTGTKVIIPRPERVIRASDPALRARLEDWEIKNSQALSEFFQKANPPKGTKFYGAAMSTDGSVVVGSGQLYNTAFLWREDVGFVHLKALADSVSRDGCKDWTINQHLSISADATTIVGGGGCAGERKSVIFRLYNPAGFSKAGKLPAIDLGELQIMGTVKNVAAKRLTISVSQITMPGGKTTPLSPTRDKIVLLPKELKLPQQARKVGGTVVITGTDGGKGKPLTARTVETRK